jgi:uncharacterized protein (TIGR03083 family)
VRDVEQLYEELPAWTGTLATLVAGADPATPVPTTPEWDLARLAGHVGGSFRWMTTIITTRATDPVRDRDSQGRPTPDDPADLPDWLREGAAELVAAVRSAGPSTVVWSWAGGSAPTAFWLQRMTYEVVVHALDAALALGRPVSIEPSLAAGGVDEWLEILPIVHAHKGTRALEPGRSLHLHATDGDLGPAGEWVLRGTDDGLTWEHGHAKADVAVRGGAGSLFLMLNRRLPADDPRFEIHGDRLVLDRWLAASVF